MGFKKYDGSTWQPINPKKLKGIPYTGTLPAVLIGTKAGYLHRYKIYGNTEQTGIPTPENPIMPSECGEKTENLFDEDDVQSVLVPSGTRFGTPISLEAGNYTVTAFSSASRGYIYAIVKHSDNTYTADSYIIVGTSTYTKTISIVSGDTLYIYNASGTGTEASTKALYEIGQIVLVKGNTAPTSYIPYGYKLPLTSAGQDVDIYPGESQTTRRIKKLVLDGTETSWNDVGGNAPYRIWLPDIVSTSDKNSVLFLSTHYRAVPNNASWVRYNACVSWSFIGITNGKWLQFRDTNQASLADFKTYLAQQYANGTPVTVWYVLATEETGTLNEPLRKIGDYADTIDSTQTNAQIPTSANSTTISWAGEGLAPSEFDSIQEWVDIPTYIYTNGAWVADN